MKITLSQIKKSGRRVNSLYNKFVLEPLAAFPAYLVINFTSLKPVAVTSLALISGVVSAYCFVNGRLYCGAVLFQLGVILDVTDGYVARIKNNGSATGMLMDVYADIVRVIINILALICWVKDDLSAVLLLTAFGLWHFAEPMLDKEFAAVRKYYGHKENVKLNAVDKMLIGIKKRLSSYGLKVILFQYQERLFAVFFIGPFLQNVKIGAVIGLIFLFFSFHLKILLDMTMIKNEIVSGTDEYVGFKDGFS